MQFTLKRLFVSVTLIAAGCAMFSLTDTFSRSREGGVNVALCLFFFMWFLVLCSAGLGNINKRPWRGAAIGLGIFALCLVYSAFTSR
jgi:hypothetical protein